MDTRSRLAAAATLLLCLIIPDAFLRAQTSEDILWVRGGGLNGPTIADLARDGSRLVTGESIKGWIRLWDVETGRLLTAFNPDTALRGGVRDLRFSRDGSRFAAVCHDSAVRLFDGYTGESLGVLPAPRSALSVEFSLTGDTLLAGDAQGGLHFFDLASMSLLDRVQLPVFSVSGLLLFPSGNRCAVVSGDSILLADSRTGEALAFLPAPLGRSSVPGHSLPIAVGDDRIFMRLDGKQGEPGGIGIFDVLRGDSVGFIDTDAKAVDLAEGGDTLFLLDRVTSDDWMVRTWSARTGAFIDSAAISIPDLYEITGLWRMMPDRHSHMIVSSIHVGLTMPAPVTIVARRRLDDSGRDREFLLTYAPVTDLRGIKETGIALVDDTGGNYLLLDCETGEERESVDYRGGGHSMSLSPDGLVRAVSAYVDENLSIRSRIDPGDRDFRYNTAYEDVPPLWVADGGDLVAYGHLVEIPRMYRKLLLTDARGIDTVCDNALLSPHASVAFAFGSDPLLAASIRDSTVLLYETLSRSARRSIPLPALAVSLAFSRNGGLLACGRSDGVISLIDAGTGAVLGEMAGHAGSVNDLQFCRGDRWLVSAGEDGAVRTWEISTGKNDYTYRHGLYGFVSVGATQDGRYVFAGGEDLSLICWMGREGIASANNRTEERKEPTLRAFYTAGTIRLSFRLERPGEVAIEIVDAAGHVHRRERRKFEEEDVRQELDSGDLPAGMYWISVRGSDQVLLSPLPVVR